MVGGELPAVAQRADTKLKPCSTSAICAPVTGDAPQRFLSRRARRRDRRHRRRRGQRAEHARRRARRHDRLQRHDRAPRIDRRHSAGSTARGAGDELVAGRERRCSGASTARTRAADSRSTASRARSDTQDGSSSASTFAPRRRCTGANALGRQSAKIRRRTRADRSSRISCWPTIPTRGIDVGAAALVQSRLIEARNGGAAVLLISFELDETLRRRRSRDRDVSRRDASGVSTASISIARRSAA